jgi:hypothetical protein
MFHSDRAMSKDPITRARVMHDRSDDKIWLRLYSGNGKHEDAIITVECLLLLVEDGAAIVRGAIQDRANK